MLPRQVQKHLLITDNLCTSTFDLAELKILTEIPVQFIWPQFCVIKIHIHKYVA
jgi:hypothetical protein